jgi:hypothetical protein
MTAQPVPVAPDSRLSKSSLISFITGLLVCVPFLGALALISGIVGFIRTGAPNVRGRWMAIVGSILGVGSLITWVLFFGAIVALVFGLTEAPKQASNDLIKALSEKNIPAAKALAPSISNEQLEYVSEFIQPSGTFESASYHNTKIVNSQCKLEGTAKFANGSRDVISHLSKTSGDWKVIGIEIGK